MRPGGRKGAVMEQVVEGADERAQRVGMVAMVAGGMFALGALGSMATDWAWVLMLVGVAGLVYVVPNLHRLQEHRDSWPGALAAYLVPVGGGVLVILGLIGIVMEATGNIDTEPGWLGAVWMLAFFSFAVGVLLFCVGAMMARRVSPAAPGLMLLGLIVAIGVDMLTGAFFEETAATTPYGLYIGMPLVGLGLAWIGYQLPRPEAASRGHGVVTG